MTALRYPALQGKRDENEPAIIAALERVGATVEQIPTGKGVPDLLCGFKGLNYLLEVKMPKGQLNSKQEKWHSKWNGQKCIVRNESDALSAIGLGDLDERCRRAGM